MNQTTQLPSWLTETDEYEPAVQKNHFVDRNIQTLQRILLTMQKTEEPKGFLAGTQAAVKLPFFCLMILWVSLSRSSAFLLIFSTLLLLILSVSPLKLIQQCLVPGLTAAALMFITLVPAWLLGYSQLLNPLILKSWMTVTLTVLLAATTPRDDLIAALKVFRMPDTFILVLDITINYIVMLSRCALAMFYAIRLRTVGRSKTFHHSFSGIGGTLFIKSQMLSQGLLDAMYCRGFDGHYRRAEHIHFHMTDCLLVLTAIAVTICFFSI
ncbi:MULTISPECIES: energy-coupling factor transporter transmembrane component T [unclassified Sporolactobacillus]|uniref:energy-coupling factor transporter transmembrane component T n=1 Tax=unclassified Sporolactobacillus TaxID=2628533 RepID=UPI002367863E|nr:energy-coupling factor transporter transmembrane component T [Sporolactobacillus sp. CQH2019]MDD9150133.1 energy-coupling factor transporter transmembrane component T [Sporolactobacillus sp. CQH2019]